MSFSGSFILCLLCWSLSHVFCSFLGVTWAVFCFFFGLPRRPQVLETPLSILENVDFRKGTGATTKCKKVILRNPLGVFLAPFGHPLGSLGIPLGALWGPLGSPWALPSAPWHSIWASLESLGSSWARSGGSRVLLGPSSCSSVPFGTHLGFQRRSRDTILKSKWMKGVHAGYPRSHFLLRMHSDYTQASAYVT